MPVAAVGAWRQHGYGNVRVREGLLIGAIAVPGALAGVVLVNVLPERATEYAFAALLVWIAWTLAQCAARAARRRPRRGRTSSADGGAPAYAVAMPLTRPELRASSRGRGWASRRRSAPWRAPPRSSCPCAMSRRASRSVSVYLLAVVIVATGGSGLRPAVGCAVLGAAAYNWFLIEPTGRFTVADSSDWYALAIFLVSAVAASALADRARSRLRLVELRRQEAALGRRPPHRTFSVTARWHRRLAAAARRVSDGLGVEGARIVTGEVPAPDGEVAIELAAPRGTVGTLLVPATLPQAVQQRLRLRVAPALGTLLAGALERDRLAAEVVETEALRRSDTLKTALLRTVSHDLRSPLTAIVAAGETLRSPTLPQTDRDELADVVVGEAQRLDELVAKLLDLSRLQAGIAEPHRDWCEIGELLHAAAEDVEARDPAGGSFSFSLQGATCRSSARIPPSWSASSRTSWRTRAASRPASPCPSAHASSDPGSSCGSSIAVGAPPAAQRRVFYPFWRGTDDRRDGDAARGSDSRSRRDSSRRTAVASRSSPLPGQGTTVVVEL